MAWVHCRAKRNKGHTVQYNRLTKKKVKLKFHWDTCNSFCCGGVNYPKSTFVNIESCNGIVDVGQQSNC